MTLAQNYVYQYERCDNCGCNLKNGENCWCGTHYTTLCNGFNLTKAKEDNVLTSSVTCVNGTEYTFTDGSVHYQTYSGW